MYNVIVRCGSGGTGRRARLRGVWFYRTGSIPVSRTNKKGSTLCRVLFVGAEDRVLCTRPLDQAIAIKFYLDFGREGIRRFAYGKCDLAVSQVARLIQAFAPT